MAEGLLVQAGSFAHTQSTNQSEAGANTRSEYSQELLMRAAVESSFEELRAERYFQNRDRERDEKLKHLRELRKQLTQELEEKQRLLLLVRSQHQVHHETPGSQTSDGDRAPAAASFQIYDESQPAASQPARTSELPQNELLDDVFLRPDERGLCLKIQCPGGLVLSGLSQENRSQTGDVIQSGLCSPSAGHNGPEVQAPAHSRPTCVPQTPVSKVPEKLSPIQETSVDSLTSLGRLSVGNYSPLGDQQGHAPSPGSSAAGGSVDPCDPDARRLLLELCDVASSPDLHSEGGRLPAVEENGRLQLGGNLYLSLSTVVYEGGFCVYKGVTDDDNVLIKVDSCSVPWDFHQFSRLKKNSSKADGLPRISCYLFLDGCVTVYTSLPDHAFAELSECDPSGLSVGLKAVGLLQMVSRLQSSRLLHAALQPHLLTCFHRDFLSPDWVFPVDWSFSVDLDLQQDVTSVQQLPSALSYISLGLLDPIAPLQLVDLVGVAKTVHLLLTNSEMVLVKDDRGWTAERFSGHGPCDRFSRMWRTFFRALLNADGPSSQSVLSALTEQMLALYH